MLGDLALDVVVAPARPLVAGTDVPGSIALRQGGSAATTARALAALGVRSTLVTSVGRDPIGRALVRDLEAAHVAVRALRVRGSRTGRIGVVLADGERSFVADRGAADALTPETLKPGWFSATAALHLPAYSLVSAPLAAAARRAVELARAAGAVVSVDLASTVPLLAHGRRAALRMIRDVSPDLLFATATESEALLGTRDPAGLIELAPVAAIKHGSAGASVLARRDHGADEGVLRFDVATRPLPAGDPTGAGDAFDAGFLAAWVREPAPVRTSVAALRRAAVAGNQAAGRYLSASRRELVL